MDGHALNPMPLEALLRRPERTSRAAAPRPHGDGSVRFEGDLGAEEAGPGGAEDARLVLAARKGDARAFEALVRRHLAVAHRVADRILEDTQDAEDACQDALIQALRHLDTLGRPEAFRAWLLTIVRNRALNMLKTRRARGTEPLASAEAMVDPAADSARGASRAEARERVKSALEGLTELQRSVVLLFDGEGWTHREIAEQLGISEGSSRVHRHAARTRLRERLEELDPFGERG